MADQAIFTRRNLIAAGGVTVLGAGAVALAACSSAPSGTPSSGTDGSPSGGTALIPGVELAPLSDLAVGGTLSVTVGGGTYLLAQPTEGQVVAFSAVCTHQGCIVAAVPTEFECPCHGSRFEAGTGAVLNGPAQEPLTQIDVVVSGDTIVAA